MKRKMCAAIAAAALALAGCFTSIADDDGTAAGGGTGSGGQAATYTVTFDSRNGSAVAPQRVEKGQTATEPAAPTKTDRTFEGWHLGEDAFDFATPITADTTLTAKWKFEDGTFTDGYLTIENGVVTECDTNATGHITIPEDVTGIGNSAFEFCPSLTSVTIPDSVMSIGGNAFYGCTNLKTVYVGSLETWLNISFNDFGATPCNNGADLYINGKLATNIVIPSTVTSIGYWAFYYCTSLASVTIPDSVTSIGISAFELCTSLTSITIPDNVTNIEFCAFQLCTSLTSVTIPDSVTNIEGWAFRSCESLKEIIFKGTAEQWSAITKGIDWNSGVPVTTKVTCTSDGTTVDLDS